MQHDFKKSRGASRVGFAFRDGFDKFGPGVGLGGLAFEPVERALPENAADIRERQKPHGEQVAAELADELLQVVPVIGVGDRFQRRKSQPDRVIDPERAEAVGHLPERSRWRAIFARRVAPLFGTDQKRVNDADDSGAEQLVERRDTPAGWRRVALHLPSDFEQLIRLAQQSDAWQSREQAFGPIERGLRAKCRRRRAAIGGRMHEQRFVTEQLQKRRQQSSAIRGVAVAERALQSRGERFPAGELVGRPSRADRWTEFRRLRQQCGERAPRRGEFNRGLHAEFEQTSPDRAPAVILHDAFESRRRLRDFDAHQSRDQAVQIGLIGACRAQPFGDGLHRRGVVAIPEIRPRGGPPQPCDRREEAQTFLGIVGIGVEWKIPDRYRLTIGEPRPLDRRRRSRGR